MSSPTEPGSPGSPGAAPAPAAGAGEKSSAKPPSNSSAGDASGAWPALTEGIVRVKVPPGRIEPFLARAPLFRGCDKAMHTKMAALVQGLECAHGSELVTAGSPNDGLGILFSGKISILVPGAGGELLAAESLEPGDCFGEVGALLDKPSPYFAISSDTSRVLWLPAGELKALLSNAPAFAEALGKRLAERVSAFAKVERPAAPEVMTDVEAQLLQVVVPTPATVAPLPPPPQAAPATANVVPFVELRDFDLQPSVLSMVPTKLIRNFRLLPVKLSGNVLTVAMVNPRDGAALAELKRTLQTVDVVVAAIGLEDFSSALVRLRLLEDTRPAKAGRTAGTDPATLQFETVADQDRDPGRDGRAVGDDVIKLVNKIIAIAIDREASDVHIEPTAAQPRVRFRVNGVLQEWSEAVPPGASLKAITARIKVLAGLDITERRLPQDGRIGLTAGRREIDLRVSTLPANRGEKIVMRVLEAAGSTRQLEQIFFEPNTLTFIRRALNRPYGGIVIAGPTGSGKTSSLYSLLNERKVTRPDSNIMMVEDPIEYRLGGVTQTQVNPAAGLAFANVLRAMLRQDPDVIVVGETRDQETALLALEAAMTGHLLLTSCHANNAVAALQRLENLGCPRPLIAQSISLVLVQRLVRKLCSACRKLDPVSPALLESLLARKAVEKTDTLLPRPVGCDACAGTGYVGRAAVVESLQISDAVREAVASGKPFTDIQQIATQQRTLVPFAEYARYLLHKQIISASEVLLSLAD